MNEVILKLAVCAVLLLASAAFSLAETSFMSLSRLQITRLSKVHPGRLDFWQKDPDRVLAVILLGNNLANVGLGVLATSLALDVERLWGLPFCWGGFLLPAAVAAAVILFGEVVPKVAARLKAEPLALALAGTMDGMTRLLGPLVQGLVALLGRALARVSRTVKADQAQWNVSLIRSLMEKASLAPHMRSVLSNLLDFGNLPVARVMAPREEVFALSLALPREEIVERVLSSGYSRVPVYDGSLDGARGILYAKDLLAHWRGRGLIVLQDLLRPALRVSGDAPLAGILRVFREGKHHMALVEDRNGRVQGLVTLQDILESIVGGIADERRRAVRRPAAGP